MIIFLSELSKTDSGLSSLLCYYLCLLVAWISFTNLDAKSFGVNKYIIESEKKINDEQEASERPGRSYLN